MNGLIKKLREESLFITEITSTDRLMDAIHKLRILDENEISELLKLVKTGNKEAIELLVIYNYRLVLSRAWQYKKSIPWEIEDLFMEGIEPLMNAIIKFDNNQTETKLTSYAVFAIDNSYKMLLTSLKRSKRFMDSFESKVSLSSPVFKREDSSLTIGDTIVDKRYEAERHRKENRDLLIDGLSCLTAKERTTIELNYGLTEDGIEYSQEEIAQQVGVSRQCVNGREKIAIDKMRTYYLKQRI